ncbi:MAG TPA: response regulator [Gaiellaceae bacterium]|nr:response regulator [Gaiellaceae bacterium]
MQALRSRIRARRTRRPRSRGGGGAEQRRRCRHEHDAEQRREKCPPWRHRHVSLHRHRGIHTARRPFGERYAEVLADHQGLLRDAFASSGGREIDTQGDAFFVVFPRAKDAIAAALSGQRALAGHRWPDGVEVRVRMGLHTGEPAAAHDRYIGLGVHRAARICAAGHGGQILLSSATYALLADDVLPDITFQDLGEYRLKDLERPERIYQLMVPDLPRAFPPARAVPADVSEDGLAPAPAAKVAKRRLRVVVADDSVLVREGLARLLAEAGFDVVARAADADELLREVGRVQTDVAITDIRMPPTHVDEGLVAAAEIRRLHPDVGVLVLSQHLDSAYATRPLEDYPERVGYLLKERVSDIAVLSDAIRRIAEGECVIDPTIVSRLMSRARREGPLATLSAREQSILTLIAEGRSDETITQHFGITRDAYEAELRDVFAKLGLSGTHDDLRRAVAVLGYLSSTVRDASHGKTQGSGSEA